jgi:hypothetical protein
MADRCRATRFREPSTHSRSIARIEFSRHLRIVRASLLRRGASREPGVVVEHRREPLLRLLGAPALAQRVILDLVALDLADAEIGALRVAEIEPAHRGARPHGEALGQRHAGRLLAAEQREQHRLLGVIGLRRIARRRTDAAVFFADQLVRREGLAGRRHDPSRARVRSSRAPQARLPWYVL